MHQNYMEQERTGCGCAREQEFDCGRTQDIQRHRHVVKHNHDIIHDYDVIHEHDFNYYDVVRERDVVRHNNFTIHTPNYCGNPEPGCGCGRTRRTPPRGGNFFRGRFW